MPAKCKYCTFNDLNMGECWPDGETELMRHNNKFYISCGSFLSDFIYHCPMCGRKLAEDI